MNDHLNGTPVIDDYSDLARFDTTAKPCPFTIRVPRTKRASPDIDLVKFLEHEVVPRLTPELVFTHPAHEWHTAGEKWRGTCPWHLSKSGTSFYVDTRSLLWRCPGCGFGGGPVQYLHRLHGGIGSPRGDDFIRVVRRLAEMAGVEFPERQLTEQEKEDARRRDARRALLEDFTTYCVNVLWSEAGMSARQYLRDRGLTDDAVREMRLGYFDNAGRVQAYLKERGHSAGDLDVCGVGSPRWEGYVTFPWNDDNGRPLTVYGSWHDRTPPDGKRKKLALPNPKDQGVDWEATKRSPYLLDRALRAGHRDLVLVEGIIDAAVAHAHDDDRVIACVGAELSHEQVKTLVRRGIKHVTICLDPDAAGEAGIASCVRQLLAAGITPYVAPKLPDGLDPDDFVCRNGVAAWREHVGRAPHAYRDSALRIVAKHLPTDGWTDQTQDAAVNEAVAYAAVQPVERTDELERHFFAVVTAETGATTESLRIRTRAQRLAASARDDRGGATSSFVGFAWRPINSVAFAVADYRPTWLVKRLLVKGQPAIIGGPKKCLKTTLLLDLAISLASGKPFLGEFTVYTPVRVAVLSGESGEFTLQETAARICRSKGISLQELNDLLLWQFTLPQLSNLTHLSALHDGLIRDRVDVVLIEPLYLSLLAGSTAGPVRAENLYEIGPLLQTITRVCLDAGATPVFGHHAKKGSGGPKNGCDGEPLDLDDLAFAGVAEFARQWLLVSRRKMYEPGTGSHQLWLKAGGSIGHGGQWAVDIEEGTIGDDFTGRTWNVTVTSSAEHHEQSGNRKQDVKAEKQGRQDKEDDGALLQALDRLNNDGRGISYQQVKVQSRLSNARMSRAFERLIEAGIVRRLEPREFSAPTGNGAMRPCVGINRSRGTEAC